MTWKNTGFKEAISNDLLTKNCLRLYEINLYNYVFRYEIKNHTPKTPNKLIETTHNGIAL